jgi:hypothetical protein
MCMYVCVYIYIDATGVYLSLEASSGPMSTCACVCVHMSVRVVMCEVLYMIWMGHMSQIFRHEIYTHAQNLELTHFYGRIDIFRP